MPSASYSGLEARVRVSADAGSTWSTWTEVQASSLSIDGVTADVTNRGTSVDGSGVPWTENKMIRRSWSATVESNLVDDSFTDTVNTHLSGLSSLLFEFAPEVGSGIPKFTGYGFITMSESSPNNDITKRSYSIVSAGSGAFANQS